MEDERRGKQTDFPYHATYRAGQTTSTDHKGLISTVILPFTHGIDASAIASALALVQHLRVQLVALSLIPLPTNRKGSRPHLGALEQSKDFLIYMQQTASRRGIPITCVERYTHDPVQSIRAFAQDNKGAGVLLFVRHGVGVLLSSNEVKHLLTDGDLSRYLVSLQPRERAVPLLTWLAGWFTKTRESKGAPTS